MLNRLSLALLALSCGSCLAPAAFAGPVTIYNTGVNNSGTALTAGQTDTHYTLISNPTGVTETAVATTADPLWIANTTTASWISPGPSGLTSWDAGDYDYRTTFNLTGDNPATADLSGDWTSDNQGCIYLNGANTGVCTGNADFGSLEAFSLSTGFISGVNTLDFIVDNTGGPTGVLTEDLSVTASATPSAVPEPSSLALLATGALSCLGGLSRRLRRQR